MSFSEQRFQDALEFYKLTLKVISVILFFVTFLVGFLSFVSKQEVSDAVDKMEKRFNKDPIIEILYKGRTLDNQVIMLTSRDSIFSLSHIELFYKGNGQTTYPSINLSFADTIKNLPLRSDLWEVDILENEYFKYHYQLNISSYETPDLRVIFPQKSDYLTEFRFIVPKSTDVITCKLEVFYENSISSVTRFSNE